jgi:CheY-like chemotaxis protein
MAGGPTPGSIGVTSQEGKGSEFYFTVRVGLGKKSKVANAEAQTSAALNSLRVLIVDDNATSREILRTLTAGWGMRPTLVEGGPWALQALYAARDKDDRFRIAIIDMQMPGMDGEALGHAIKADERPMVMLTSLGSRKLPRSHKHLGFCGCATKPVRRQELLRLLANALSTGACSNSDGAKSRDVELLAAHREAVGLFDSVNMRILLAEDNSTNREVALGMLRKLGLGADAVADGAEAVTALESIPYDLVLMDMRMPVMDGIEATRQIRSLPPMPETLTR